MHMLINYTNYLPSSLLPTVVDSSTAGGASVTAPSGVAAEATGTGPLTMTGAAPSSFDTVSGVGWYDDDDVDGCPMHVLDGGVYRTPLTALSSAAIKQPIHEGSNEAGLIQPDSFNRIYSTGLIQQDSFNRTHSTGLVQPDSFTRTHSTGLIEPDSFNRTRSTELVQSDSFNRTHSTGLIQPDSFNRTR